MVAKITGAIAPLLVALCLFVPAHANAQKSIIGSDPKVSQATREKIDALLLSADKARNAAVMSQVLLNLLQAADWLDLREIELRLRELGAHAHLIAMPVSTAPKGITAQFMWERAASFLQSAARVPPYYLYITVNGEEEAKSMLKVAGIPSFANNQSRLRLTGFMTPLTNAYSRYEPNPDPANLPSDKEKADLYSVLQRYVREGILDNDSQHVVARIVNDFLEKSGATQKFSVNNQPDQAIVNVYILRSDPLGHFGDMDCNCGFIPGTSVIVCDYKFLNQFSRMTQIDPSELGAQYRDGIEVVNLHFSYFLMQWTLGHELGHLTSGHSFDTNYFDAEPMLSRENRIPPKVRREFEIAADRFAITNLSDQAQMFYAWLGLSNVISSNYANAIRKQFERDGIRYSPGDIKPLKADVNVTLLDTKIAHPPFLLRATELAKVVLEVHEKNGIVDTSGHFDRILKHLTLSKDGIPSQNMCASQEK